MRIALKLGVLGVIAGAVALPAREARAGDDPGTIILGVTLVSAAFGADVAFTAYDVSKVRKNAEPDFKWMTAQTIVTSPQAVLGHVPLIVATMDHEESEAFGLFLPLSVWGNQMATYGAWSMGSQDVRPAARYGVSWMIGADLPLTTTALAGFFTTEHYTRPWHAVSELAMCSPQVAYSIYQSAHDPQSRAGWIGMAAWSGTLVAHGAVSLIMSLTHTDDTTATPPPPIPPPPLPPPPPPYYNDPVRAVPNARQPAVPNEEPSLTPKLEVPGDPTRPPSQPSPRETPPRAPKLHADIAPTPISDGFRVVPGLMVFGTF